MPLMGRRLIFVDTETTSLDKKVALPWEIALIDEDGKSLHLLLDVDLSQADPDSLVFGHYYERSPASDRYAGEDDDIEFVDHDRLDEAKERIAEFCKDAVIVAANPAFDTCVLINLIGHEPWHYHLLDVEAMAVQRMIDRGIQLPPKWSSYELSAGCEVDPPSATEAHTALGDAMWVKRWYERLVA